MKNGTMVVDLMRHGEPLGGRRYRGQIDDPLSERGWQQMQAATKNRGSWDSVVTSPLSRCLAFSETLARQRGLSLKVEPRFMEIGFGSWEGKTAEEISREDHEALMNFYRDPVRHPPPGAEPVADFQKRVGAAWRELLEGEAGRHVLVVSHAGTIRMVLQAVLELPLSSLFRIRVENAGVTRIRVDSGFAQLVSHGNCATASAQRLRAWR